MMNNNKRPTALELFDVFGNKQDDDLNDGMRDSMTLFRAHTGFKRIDSYGLVAIYKDWEIAQFVFARMTDAELRQFSELGRKVVARDDADRNGGSVQPRIQVRIDTFIKLLDLIDAYAGGDDIDVAALEEADEVEHEARKARMSKMSPFIFY